MGLVAAIATRTGLNEELAGRAAGALLASVKLSLPKDALAPIQQAVPDLDALVARAHAAPAARTGEMLAVMAELSSERGAALLGGQLARIGLAPTQVPGLVGAFLEELTAAAGAPAAQALVARLPGLAVLAR